MVGLKIVTYNLYGEKLDTFTFVGHTGENTDRRKKAIKKFYVDVTTYIVIK